MVPRNSSRARSERGAIAVTATVFVFALSGISFAVLAEVTASKKAFDRGEADLRALEAAETGLARAEVELSSKKDPDKDGLGTLSGTYAGARFNVTATQDPVLTDQWTLNARGVQSAGGRQIEVRVRRTPVGAWGYGMFATNTITVGGGSNTDSYDSRLGTYASQATNSDKFGTYASAGGAIGANGSITVTSAEVRGNSSAGPGYSTTVAGTGKVTGTTTSLSKAVALPDTALTTFVGAATVNDNGSWLTTGGTVYDPIKKSLTVSGGNTLTLTKSTYFFSSITLSGNSTLKVTKGPVKIYVTDKIDFAGGAVSNSTNLAVNLQFYEEPYALPVGYAPTTKTATFTGGSNSDFTFYGPSTPVTLSGKGTVTGAIVGKTITIMGGTPFHYDLALLDEMDVGNAAIDRIYWRDVAPPMR